MSIPQILLTLDEADRIRAGAALLDMQTTHAAMAAARPGKNDPKPFNKLVRELSKAP